MEEVIRTLSNFPPAVSHGITAAKIVQKIVLDKNNTTSADIIETVKNEISDKFPDVVHSIDSVRQHIKKDHVSAVGDVFGRPCYNPGSFQVSLPI